MVGGKNRGFQSWGRVTHPLCVGLLSWVVLGVGCERRPSAPSVMVASSLSVPMERWAQDQERALTWQSAGSQRIRLWLEGGAKPLFSVLASQRYVDALTSSGLATWTLTLGCSEVALARLGSPQARRAPRMTLAEWRSWGEGLSEDARVAMSAEEVPLGSLSKALLTQTERRFGAEWRRRVEGAVVTQALSASSTATLLMTGEADAALLFTVMSYGRPTLNFTALPAEVKAEVAYQAVGSDAQGQASAERFKSWLLARPELGLTPCRGAAETEATEAEGISP